MKNLNDIILLAVENVAEVALLWAVDDMEAMSCREDFPRL